MIKAKFQQCKRSAGVLMGSTFAKKLLVFLVVTGKLLAGAAIFAVGTLAIITSGNTEADLSALLRTWLRVCVPISLFVGYPLFCLIESYYNAGERTVEVINERLNETVGEMKWGE